ncbi:MarR family winged helix-turn-helix transcriptional regulator [uncultured Pseudokineococcus sp.]|uniref:MarR family winged helix-turn-helix transcriptional regulator n=1 Tax=uncultured Pseudokineococcus sp. TaxID=1642928 RepID=UPI00260D6A26|nr:MarR family transcriptional regulator [uncultured Pseudokineococcus sp.]
MSAAESDLPVDQRLCLALYQASHAMDATYRVLLGDSGLTYPQYTVLSVLRQDGAAPVTVVARRLGLSSNTVSPLLKRMEGRGWITRRRSGEDERAVIVDLTAEGRRLGDEVGDVPRRVTDAAGLSDAQQTDLVGTLHQLAAALRAGPAQEA